MAKYIERRALFDALYDADAITAKGIEIFRSFQTADVRPVVHGKWIKPTIVPDSMLDECSVCGFDTGAYTFNFCPNCGAEMREES